MFELKLSPSYSETVRELERGEVKAAFLGSYIFAKENRGQLRAILKPLNENGLPYFRSALIVRENSVLYHVHDLKGEKIAVPSDESFSGNWFQNIAVKKYGMKISDFEEIRHFAFHNSVVKQVLMKNFGAGVVKDRVAKEYSENGIRTILYSEPVPGSPLVVSSGCDSNLVKILTDALLKADKKSIGNWDREFAFGFVRAQNSDYEKLKELVAEMRNDGN